MVLVDTSVWIDHLRRADPELVVRLERGIVLAHPFVIGEIACGTLRRRADVLASLRALPAAPVATDDEAMGFVERHALAGSGVGWVAVHLLAASTLAGGARLWTRDKRLAAVADRLRLRDRSLP